MPSSSDQNPDKELRQLRALARLYGIQPSYYDREGKLRWASREGLARTITALHGSLPTDQLTETLNVRRTELATRGCAPVTVIPEGSPATLMLCMKESASFSTIHCFTVLESGEHLPPEDPIQLDLCRTVSRFESDGLRYVVKKVIIPKVFPIGYHSVSIVPSAGIKFRLIVAPRKTYYPPGFDKKAWGTFMPLYALGSDRGVGIGDFSDLGRLMDWTRGLGGGVVATLPMLASFLDDPLEPSPYAPVSRLFWNDFYVDPTQAEEFEVSSEARALWASAAEGEFVRAQKQKQLVDFKGLMALKRRVLETMANDFFARGAHRHPDYAEFEKVRPDVTEYANFRALTENRKDPFPEWEEVERGIGVGENEFDPKARNYHAYVQYLAHTQLKALARKGRENGLGMYLDLPLGVHPRGYDVWRYRRSFALGVCAGAPPDPFFSKGQNWGFPPINPMLEREQGYRYTIEYIRNHLRYAGVLRLDHIMGLHRLYWIPDGLEATDGVYVRSRAEELYAILCVESHRHKALIVGEDLGTVPPSVRQGMEQHGIMRMSVAQFDFNADPENAIASPPENSVVSLNTHDLPPFASFWSGADIKDRESLGLLSPDEAARERNERERIKSGVIEFLRRKGWMEGPESDTLSVLRGCLRCLSASQAKILMVNLEDLWLETRPQNTPGIGAERPSWRRKARLGFEEFSGMESVLRTLRMVDDLRKK